MKRRNGIDLFRLIGAFFIMCLHTEYGNLQQEYVDNLRLLSRWAVPFFFITTGFFLGSKIENDILDFKKIQKNVSLLISILVVSSIIYFPINVMKGDIPSRIVNILTGSYFHLWFIGSLLVGYISIWYLFFIKKHKILPYLSIGILLIALLTDSYDQLFNIKLDSSLSRFLLAIPFIHIGIIFSKKEINGIGYKLIIGLVLIGFLIQCFEGEMFLKLFHYKKFEHKILLGTIVLASSLFVLSSRLDINENKLSKLGKKYALFIYLYHPIVYMSMRILLSKTIPNYYDNIEVFSPLIGFTLILAFSIIIDRFFPKIYNIMNGDFQLKTRANNI